MSRSPTTTPTGRRLSEIARKVTGPADIAGTGWPAVRNVCERKLGVPFDDWQHEAGKLILAKRADGSLASRIDGVGMSLPRQVGKTYLIAALVFALCILRPGLLVIWSAHHSKTHAETFRAMQAFAKRLKVAPFVRQVRTGSGDEQIIFHNGARILFGAREHGFGRGIPGVDVMVFDEAQILSDKALANMLATMNTSALGLALYVGTPPRPDDNSESFHRMRAAAYAGELVDGAWIEFGAERGDNPLDPKVRAKANPSYPHRTSDASIERLRRKLTPEDFLREGLGIWDDDSSGWHIVTSTQWHDLEREPRSLRKRAGTPSLAIAATPDLTRAALAAAVRHNGKTWVRVLAYGPGVSWLPKVVKRQQLKLDAPVIVDKGGPCSSLIDGLLDVGVDVTEVGSGELCDAAALWVTGITEKRSLRHMGDDELEQAMRAAQWRDIGDRRALGRRKGGDICPAEAGSLAAWHAETNDYDIDESVL